MPTPPTLSHLKNRAIKKTNPSLRPKLAVKDFFKTAKQLSYQLSPNNQHLAFMQPWEEGHRRLNVFVLPVTDLKAKPQRITSSLRRDIYGFTWVNNTTIVFAVDQGGDENVHIHAVSVTNPNTKNLTPFENVKAGLLDDLEDDAEHILITLNKRDPELHDVYKLNVHDTTLTLVAKNPGTISQWLCDHQGNVRAATTTDGVNTSLLYRKNAQSPFQTILTTDFKTTLSPLAFHAKGHLLYVASNRGRDTSAVYTFDPDRACEQDLIFEHPEVDVHSLVLSRKTKHPICSVYTTEKPHYHFYEPNAKALHQRLETLLPGMEIAFRYSRDESLAIVHCSSDLSRGSYYLYHISTEKLEHLSDLSPWLPEKDMAPMRPIQYTARDGLTLHGYLTLPLDRAPTSLPVIVHPHGGPWARDVWGFNPEVQFLAYHGYAVLQVNFRGSTGYGRTFWEKSFKQWGKAMQDDITDGVYWLINKGIADPKRIAIYGASYGGYATLAGLTFTPELYACGVDYVGISSLFSFMQSIPPYWKLYLAMLYEMVGHPEHDQAQLRATSPLFHATAIRAPLLIAQGANDPRVKQEESDQIVQALRERGVDVEYMLKENEGHGFANEENRFDFYNTLLVFLNKHLS